MSKLLGVHDFLTRLPCAYPLLMSSINNLVNGREKLRSQHLGDSSSGKVVYSFSAYWPWGRILPGPD